MPSSKRMFLMAYGLIIIVGGWVVLQDPAPDRDWYGFACAMLLMPLVFVFMGIIWAFTKAVALVPYLLIRTLFDRGVPYRWYKTHGNWQSLKRMFFWRDFSCFYIADKIGNVKYDRYKSNIPHKRTKEEYEKLHREGKL